jgi:RND family efflux transporter MFP subunit
MSKAGSGRTTLAVVAALILSACGGDNRYAAPPPRKVTVALPLEQEVSRHFDATGNTAAVNTVDLVARVQGFVQGINYTDGEFVKRGTSLFTIEPEPYKLRVEAAQASVTSASATLKQAEAEYQRQADLVARQIATQAAYDRALAARDSGRADLQSAQVNEQQAEINLGYTNVAAPFDGVVSARQVSIGQLVGANSATVLSTIVQLDPIYANFTASERDVLQVRADLARSGRTVADLLGMPVEIGLQTDIGFPHKGKLDYIAPTVDPSTGTIAARATLENADRLLLPGYFVRVRISARPQPVLLVPDAALGSDQGGRYLLVVKKDNVVEQRNVQPGQLIGDLRVIEQGVTKDDRVVIGGIMRAIPGQKVDPELRSAASN